MSTVSSSGPNPLLCKLETFADLSDADRTAIEFLTSRRRNYRAGEDLIREGNRPDHVFLLMEGWAYRYKALSNGKRQILAYLLPGDFCDTSISSCSSSWITAWRR